MRARFIYEKFIEGGDPIKQMGIGGKKGIDLEIKRLRGTVPEDEYIDFIEAFAEEKGGAFEIYLDYEQQEELYLLCKLLGKSRIKVRTIDVDDYEGNLEDENEILDRMYNRKVQPWIDKGWDIWWEEENYDVTQYILVKYP